MKRLQCALGAAVLLSLTLSISAWTQSKAPGELAQPHGGSLNVHRHGYEHGYRDGFQFGQYDRSQKAAYNYKTNPKYLRGDLGYEDYMGDRAQFVQGYQIGFRSGYTDGFYGSPGRFSSIYGKPAPQFVSGKNAPAEPEDSADDIYAAKQWSMTDVATDIGYRDGIIDGESDRLYNGDKEPTFHLHYRRANHGYRVDYGNEQQYQQLYRIAYRRGYRDGFQAVRPAPKALQFVSAPTVEQHTDNVAIIAWSTNAKTAGTVYYTSNKFNFDQTSSLQEALVHRVELKNLQPATTYKLFVRTQYNDITQTSREFTLTTSPKTTKILFTADGVPRIEQITENSALISWKTNIDSSGSVLYRTSPKGPSKLAEDLSLSTDHHVKITNLSPGTKYYFTIWSSPVCITDHEKFTFETLGRQQVAAKQ